jgi:tetratricopeptide (TPR) repeat protein
LRGTSVRHISYARALVKAHGEVPQWFPILQNLGSFHGFRGEFDKGIHYAKEILRLADAEGDANMRVFGYAMLGADTGFSGRMEEGLGYLDTAIESFENGDYRPGRHRFGIDTRISCLTTSGFFLWLSGYPDRAVERAARAVALATAIDHPYSLAYAYYHAGFLHLWRREPEIVRDRAAASLRVAETIDLPVWRALATCLLGASTSALGRPEEGLRQIADGLDLYEGLRTPPVFWPMLLFMQAAAHVEAGTPGPGLALIDEALAIAGTDAVMAPHFHIVRGDLSLLGPAPDTAAATASYERAFAVAEGYGARMPQLRAAVRLCGVADEPARADRLQALRAVHATFAEGLSTPDLRDAAELLA